MGWMMVVVCSSALLIALLVALVGCSQRQAWRDLQPMRCRTARALRRGDIDQAEYDQRRRVLRGEARRQRPRS